jgi:hypothetical protein
MTGDSPDVLSLHLREISASLVQMKLSYYKSWGSIRETKQESFGKVLKLNEYLIIITEMLQYGKMRLIMTVSVSHQALLHLSCSFGDLHFELF